MAPKKTASFIERTIEGTVSVLLEAVSIERIAAQSGFLQQRDARFKLITALLFVCAAVATRSIVVLCVLYALVLTMVLVSRISLSSFLKRTLPFIPLFSLFIAVPAIFSFVTPGAAITSFTVAGKTVGITQQGIDTAVLFVMRVLTCVSATILLTLSTRQHVLLKALRMVGVPSVFVLTMGMTYRYIFLLLDIMQKLFISIKSRVGFVSSSKDGRQIVAANMAGMWLRSYRLQSQVYDAMLSRGFTGEIRTLHTFKSSALDYFMIGCSLCTLIGSIWLNRFFA